jgi:ABC-type polysaccharide/polyol phosphate transport system, ATPase component
LSIVIDVEGLGKKYILRHHQPERYATLRDVLANKFSFWVQRLTYLSQDKLTAHAQNEEFWALKDVSFQVSQGERIGIIGRNGAGKSTLLKLLSRVTKPSKGRAKIKGRVASLLEVGTGFHPELTGRENIYLNGAILGMTKQEIKKKFDEIVDFAEVEKFLDTPVKRFSSGMYVRLAFSVAAHMEPEILIVDEVLAVGDARFQKKCLGKMDGVSKDGRTIIVVSHQMPMINNLCTRCILLRSGNIVRQGKPDDIIPFYLEEDSNTSTEWLSSPDDTRRTLGMPTFQLERFALVDENSGAIDYAVDASKPAYVLIEGYISNPTQLLCLGFVLSDERGNDLFLSNHTDQPTEQWPELNRGKFALRAMLDFSILNEGKYRIYFISSIHCERMLYEGEITIGFEIAGNQSKSPYWIGRRNTILAPALRWELLR